MADLDPGFVAFLVRAKRAGYASGGAAQAAASRPGSVDLPYTEGAYAYLDTYLGGHSFIGEEVVWKNGAALWGMNYYGAMTVEHIPDGFSDFLKLALQNVPAEAPYRGPAALARGEFAYACRWEGGPALFHGAETVTLAGQVIYLLHFHGGLIR